MSKEAFESEMLRLLGEYAKHGGYDENITLVGDGKDGSRYYILVARQRSDAEMMVEKAFGEKAAT